MTRSRPICSNRSCAAGLSRSLAILVLPWLSAAQAANIWDGGAGDGLWATATNWDDDALPTGNPVFPAAAPDKQVNLGGDRYHERVILQGGFRLFGGRMVVFGGGANAEIESAGDNTFDADYGTEVWGNSVKLIQNSGGTLLLNGSSTGFQKSIELRSHGTIVISGNVAPGGGEAFYKTGSGITRFTPVATLQGAPGGRFLSAGTLLFNGTADGTAPWTVDGGNLGGTGSLNSSVSVGATRPSTITPGDPATANGLGTLAVTGNVTFAENSTLVVQIGAPGTSDRLTLTGAISIGARTGLWVKVAPGATPAGTYTLLTHGGARTGRFVLLDAPAGTTMDDSIPGEIRVVISAPPAAENIVFPGSAEIVDVTQAPYNAIPNDGLDDTTAIQTALDAFPNGRRIIYLPNGIYDVSDTLNWPAGIPGWTDYKHTILQGQSRDGAVLRLKNNAPLFQNPAARRAVIFTGPAPAQRFGIMIRNLTVNTGTGNPGASGVQLNANNFGGMRMVRIVSGDGQGVIGLDFFFTAEIGPLFVQDVEIEGFDYGLRSGDAINGLVLERITVRGQNVAGINPSGQVCSIRGFKSVNAVPAVIAGTNPFGGLDTGGACTLLDAQLIGLPGTENLNAITTSAFFYGRNIVSTGYTRVLTRPTLAGNANVEGSSIEEYQSHPSLSLFTSPARSLQLPIEDPPTIPLDASADWANVRSFGAVGNGSTDDTAAFQAAIDSGKPTVFIPPDGYFIIHGDVLLRGNVRRFTGTHANLGGSGRLVVVEGTAPAVIIERSGFPAILHQAARTLIVSSSEVAGITSTSAGKLFIEDVVTDRVDLQNPRQRVWARQLNTENGSATNVINAGATLWVLGYKTERGQVKIETRVGGFTELLGAHIYSTDGAKTTPLFTIDDASASFACVAESNFSGTNYTEWVREKRGSTTNTLQDSGVPFRTSANGRAMTLYTGFDGAPKRPLDFTTAPVTPTSATLTWNDQAWDETGYSIEWSNNGTDWNPVTTTAPNIASFTDTTLSPGTTRHYRLRANNATASSAAAAASITTLSLFKDWLQGYGLASNSDPLLDPDFDGLGLFLEYALGGAPNTHDAARLPVQQISSGTFSLTYARSRAELTYLVEQSPNLANASWSATGVNQGTPGATVTATYPITSQPRFFRLRITGP